MSIVFSVKDYGHNVHMEGLSSSLHKPESAYNPLKAHKVMSNWEQAVRGCFLGIA